MGKCSTRRNLISCAFLYFFVFTLLLLNCVDGIACSRPDCIQIARNCRINFRHQCCRGVSAKRDLNQHRFIETDEDESWMEPIRFRNANKNYVKLRDLFDNIEDTFKNNFNGVEGTTD